MLTQAKAEVDFDAYVGHVQITEQWSAAEIGYERYEVIECCDETIEATHLESCDGEHTLVEIDIQKESFVPEDFFDTIDPDQEEFEEATGNEGATLDKQYNWTALFLWPSRKRPSVIGISTMVKLFQQDVDAARRGLDDVARNMLIEIRRSRPSVHTCILFLQALQVVGDIKLIAEMLDVIAGIKESYGFYGSFIGDATFFSSLMAIGHKHGWNILKSPLQAMFANCSSSSVEKYCAFLNKITSSEMGHEKDLCTNLLSVIVKVLVDEPDATPDSSSSSMWLYRSFDLPKIYRSKDFVSQLFGLLTTVGSSDLFASTVGVLRAKLGRYPVLETLGPTIVDFYKSTKVEKDGPLQVILTYCVSQLEVSLCKVAAAPTTNAKPVRFTCSCKDCVELIQFLKHPTVVQHRFKISKQRRRHLHRQLDSSRAYVTHTTEHYGSPHTLVVTKTNVSHEKDIKRQQQQRALLASLQPLLPVTDVDVPSENEPPTKKRKGITTKVDTSSSSHIAIDLT